MLIIKPVEDERLRTIYAEACETSYIENDFVYFTADADVATFEVRRVIGYCQFAFDDTSAVIHTFKIAPGIDDDEAMQLLGRTVANFVYRCGAEFMRMPLESECDTRIAKMLGFLEEDDGSLALNVKNFYETPCKFH